MSSAPAEQLPSTCKRRGSASKYRWKQQRPTLRRGSVARGGFLLLTALVTVCVPLQAKEQGIAFANAAKVDAAVRAEMTRQGLVGVSVGVLQKGKIVYLQGYGLADREKKVPVTVDTVFNWASNSKPLCGMAAMQLVEKGLLDLDADVRRYVPEFPEQKEGVITMRHLLSHQSGIAHYEGIPAPRDPVAASPSFDPVHSLSTFSAAPLVFKPGEKVLYSSYAYILASAVVQRAGKEPYLDQIEKRIRRPLGLSSLQLDTEYKEQPHWATGYTKDESGAVVRAPENAHWWKYGAGGHKSNIRDFALWAQAVLNHRLIAPATEAAMWTPQKTGDGQGTVRALGFIVDDQGGLRVSHGGKQAETTTRLVLYPKPGHGLVVMTNCGFGDTTAITTAIYRALSSRPTASAK